ncbi:hypothetical protein [Paenibacillus solani]|uniref:Epimerase n=1 Tax=Paenibacillus solani TaxID=1705565 RepID=A0A0M1P423_9BACL|nr:hypothetical protein [Paenibacillus solani]KOR89233.1 epimerase [Paenibacillus solani]
MSEQLALSFFGEYLVKRVRDEAIDDWERILSGKMKDQGSQQVFQALKSFDAEQLKFIFNMFPKIIDTTLHHLLWSLEQEEDINVMIKSNDHVFVNIKEVSDGLAGELYTEDGWISRFSSKKQLKI